VPAAVARLGERCAVLRCVIRDVRILPEPLPSAEFERRDLAAQRRDDDDLCPAGGQFRRPDGGRAGVAHNSVAGSVPRVAKMRAMASPILLLGVLAPAVMPTCTAPESGSQRATSISALRPMGL